MAISVTVLGSNSAIPALQRHPSAQVVSIDQTLILVDCGEATQIQMRKYGIKFQRISHILISHLHGDHYFGLIGLLNTMHLLGREKELTLFGPPELKEIIYLQLKVAKTRFRYPLNFQPLDFQNTGLIFENQKFRISTVPLEHRIPCFGFVFEEVPGPGNIKKEIIEKYQPSIADLQRIKRGEDLVLANGSVVPNKDLTTPPPPPKKYAYVTDTRPTEHYLEGISGADLLYHEATFKVDSAERAHETHHSTTHQAAEIAHKTGARRLLIGHFSTRYKDLQPLLDETREVFDQAELALEGETYLL
ncbi:ribonuclease Z [bacterium SCSIO 12741]|nr:ribonuclease Z [bacterium SCSIO 12741]